MLLCLRAHPHASAHLDFTNGDKIDFACGKYLHSMRILTLMVQQIA